MICTANRRNTTNGSGNMIHSNFRTVKHGDVKKKTSFLNIWLNVNCSRNWLKGHKTHWTWDSKNTVSSLTDAQYTNGLAWNDPLFRDSFRTCFCRYSVETVIFCPGHGWPWPCLVQPLLSSGDQSLWEGWSMAARTGIVGGIGRLAVPFFCAVCIGIVSGW